MVGKWFDRSFDFDTSLDRAEEFVDRLRETPERLTACARLEPEVLTRRRGERWSIQENLGHLLDLEPLWAGRIDDILQGEKVLRPADLTNQKTHQARHNDADLAEILRGFAAARGALVQVLEQLSTDDFGRAARHPRLDQPMRILDLCEFVAEHDDHHLRVIQELLDS